MWLGIIVNCLLVLVLGTWFLWWRRASRHIDSFREARVEMGGLMTQLQDQLAVAQAEIASVSSVARAALPDLEASVRRADALILEMHGVIAAGERIADRIEEVTRQARIASQAPAVDAFARADLGDASARLRRLVAQHGLAEDPAPAPTAPAVAAPSAVAPSEAPARRKLFRGRVGGARPRPDDVSYPQPTL